MSLSDYEISKIAAIAAGKVGKDLDAKTLRRIVDTVVETMQKQRGNPEIEGVTCDVPRPKAPEGPGATYKPRTPLPPDEELMTETGGLYEQIERTDRARLIIAAFGKDRPGVVAAISKVLGDASCTIEDISQTLMQEFFSMIMIANMKDATTDFATLRDQLKECEQRLGMKVYVMHEDIFRYMHRI
jgi:ACT domain-containing protein